MSVVVIGDANVDLELRLPDTPSVLPHANPDPEVHGGGSAANTAAALAKLGVPCRFVGTVGDDDYGRIARQSLLDAGVDVAGIATVSGSSTVMVIVVVTPSGERLIYVWPPSGGAHAELSSDQAITAIGDARWLHVSGICLRFGSTRHALLSAMDHARARGVSVSLDLNLRLENWGWTGDFRDTVMTAVDLSDVVFGAARDEIAALARHEDPEHAASLLAGEERLVVARLGADGSFVSSQRRLVRAPSYPVHAVDTVGAGDAFNAGFIAARLAGGDVSEAQRWANATGALATTRRGARSTPSRTEVMALIAE